MNFQKKLTHCGIIRIRLTSSYFEKYSKGLSLNYKAKGSSLSVPNQHYGESKTNKSVNLKKITLHCGIFGNSENTKHIKIQV